MITKAYSYLVLIIAFELLLISCGQIKKTDTKNESREIVSNPEGFSKNDSIHLIDSSKINSQEKIYVVERGRFSNEKYTLYVNTIYLIPDKLEKDGNYLRDSSYYRRGNYLYIINKFSNQIDSIRLEDDPDGFVDIKDESSLLSGKAPLFKVSWIGYSDVDTHQFWGFRNDSFQILFEIDRLVELKRKNEFELAGTVIDRDELVSSFEEYPVKILLKDYTVVYDLPNNQEIGYPTTVLSNFTAYRILDNKPYLLKVGAEIIIDSIYRKTKVARILTKDSTILQVPFSTIIGKVQVNAAG